jgi:hypothetical protein
MGAEQRAEKFQSSRAPSRVCEDITFYFNALGFMDCELHKQKPKKKESEA